MQGHKGCMNAGFMNRPSLTNGWRSGHHGLIGPPRGGPDPVHGPRQVMVDATQRPVDRRLVARGRLCRLNRVRFRLVACQAGSVVFRFRARACAPDIGGAVFARKRFDIISVGLVLRPGQSCGRGAEQLSPIDGSDGPGVCHL